MLAGFEMIKREDIFNFTKGLLPAGLNYPGGISFYYIFTNKNQKNMCMPGTTAKGSCVQLFHLDESEILNTRTKI